MALSLVGGLPRNLIYQDDTEPGYLRVKRGRGHSYLDEGQKLSDKEVLEWISSLGIPPDWKDVWISKDRNGHLLATGYDAKGRKQYYYHPLWSKYRNEAKFRRMKLFGMTLPTIRKKTKEDLKRKGWPKEKVLALTIQILDQYGIRIGNERYKRENQTFGLTTLRRKHLDFQKGVGRLEYKAKSGKYRQISIKKGQLARLVKGCSELPGYEIFKYKGDDGKYHHVRSQDVNEYLQEVSQKEFTCKDFRTWHGTIMAVKKLEEAQKTVAENPRKKLDATVVKLVSEELGNTVSVCRDYYIHPKVMKAVLVEEKLAKIKKKKLKNLSSEAEEYLDECEQHVLRIIS
uniref:DNA topoisomerase n=1 Tax=Roseihalotalea indica TaxID=2867963 RepID=A0AA49GS38_9BACT|nr:DNA topoisomerase IB [Tunicatimonas sp. TK19036]